MTGWLDRLLGRGKAGPPQPPKSVPLQIWEAIRTGAIADLERLFRENPDEVDGYTFFAGGTYLHFAAANAVNAAVVAAMLDIGFGVNKPSTGEGELAICPACGAGNIAIVRLLLDRGSLLDVSTPIRNPLISAIIGYQPHRKENRGDHLEIARMLIERGIDVTPVYRSEANGDLDAIAWAMLWGRTDIARLIAVRLHGGDEAEVEAALADADRRARAGGS